MNKTITPPAPAPAPAPVPAPAPPAPAAPLPFAALPPPLQYPAPAPAPALIPICLVVPITVPTEVRAGGRGIGPVGALPPTITHPTTYNFGAQGANHHLSGTLNIIDTAPQPPKNKQVHVLGHRSADGTIQFLRGPDGRKLLHGYEGHARIGETGDWFWVHKSDYV
jgi:hypothetical protein